MLNKEDIKLKSYEVIDKNSDKLIQLAKTISKNAETGFKEFNTSKLVKEWFDELQIKHENNIAITGVNGIVNSTKKGPTISVIGELDSNIVPGHPEGNPETGAGHACGHQIQIANFVKFILKKLINPYKLKLLHISKYLSTTLLADGLVNKIRVVIINKIIIMEIL